MIRTADWMVQAACRLDREAHTLGQITQRAELFFEPQNETEAIAARVLCAGCPVQRACLRTAIDSGIDSGIWGGLDPQQRREVARQWRARAA